MDSDDELMMAPKPVPKPAAVALDDSDDDLMVAPPKPAASPLNNKPAVVLEDSDDELLPPTATATAASPTTGAAANANANAAAVVGGGRVTSPVAQSSPVTNSYRDPNPSPAQTTPTPTAAPTSAAAATSPTAANTATLAGSKLVSDAVSSPTESENIRSRNKTFVKKQLNKEGFLSKLQPQWPYSPQRRWCVLQGRMFSYYDTQGAAKPSATLDLKGAEIMIDPPGAREPNSFGIGNIESGGGGSSSLKGRVFILSASTKEEMAEWVDALRSVLNDGHSEVHWFEKMATGTC